MDVPGYFVDASMVQPIFTIRNGPTVNATPLYSYGSSPVNTYWVEILNLPFDRRIQAAPAFAAAAYAQLAATATYTPEGGAALDDIGMARHAQILGYTRAAMSAFYEIMPADLQTAETVPGMLEYWVPGAAAGAQPALANAPAPLPVAPAPAGLAPPAGAMAGAIRLTDASRLDRPGARVCPAHAHAVIARNGIQAVAAAAQAAAGAAPPPPPVIDASIAHLTDAQIVFMAGSQPNSFAAWFLSFAQLVPLATAQILIRLGAALPVYQGYNLCMSDHHHLSRGGGLPPLSAGMVNEYFGTAGGAPPLSDSGTWDTAFHKAAHPIRVMLKMAWAGETRIRDIMQKTLNRALAARLPFRPSIMRVAETYLLVMSDAGTVIAQHGGTFNLGLFPAVVLYAQRVANAGPGAPAPANAPVTDRVLGIVMDNTNTELVLEQAVKRAAPIASYCYGVYATVVNKATAVANVTTNPRMGARGANTVINAYSLLKLVSQQAASFAQGVTFAESVDIAVKRLARSNKLLTPTLDFDAGILSGAVP